MEYSGGEEDEIELSLGLSIGGCRKRLKTSIEAPGSGEGKVVEDVSKRKEMQAMRRREARKKREVKKKQMKRNDVVQVEAEATKSELNAVSYSAFPVYAYPSSFQYMPFANGFAFPCVVPAGVYGADRMEKCVDKQTVSFRPWNGQNEDGNVKALSNGSVGCCSSAVSENRSNSSQDGSNSDSASHRSHSRSAKTELHSSTSGSDMPGSSLPRLTLPIVSEEDSTAVELKPVNIPISRTKDSKVETNGPGKPPKPQPSDNKKLTSPLSQMPCVSATGNGPEGKTITGFLYRYNTTAEVSIVCVCHGESFSPAEFVKHAGGVDITHPLRHITVVPSAF